MSISKLVFKNITCVNKITEIVKMRRLKKLLTFVFCASWLLGILVLVGNFPVNGQVDCGVISCPVPLCKLRNSTSDLKQDFCERIKCVGITENSCPKGSQYEENLLMCGCCPGCAIYIDYNETCDPTPNPPEISLENCQGSVCPIKMNLCRKGLECQQGNKRVCMMPKSVPANECEYKRSLYASGQLHWQPECDSDGSYSPKQCKGAFYDGTCFCVNKMGDRIFGREYHSKADNMTCACSRRVFQLRQDESQISTLHCTSEGNFEPLQCDMDSGLCYCVDTKTGDMVGPIVPENQWKNLPCYNRTYWGDDGHYLRRCESTWAAWKKLKIEASLHGLKEISAGDTNICDYDGSFAPKQSEGNRDICVFKNGAQIADYFELQGVMTNMTCQCARDNVIAREEGKPFALRCAKKSGNYDTTSESKADYVRCVDKDGFFFGEDVENKYDCCLKAECIQAPLLADCTKLGITPCASRQT